ncbi:hypothetical protein VISI1226_09864 [Vibrio sinaloensis DSM 21326]|uniref:DUF4397 domain-containing protein n=1 Tax=Vibrio sinaloensis DSM 21326 TaxID=945550 RepID=E8M9C1_PHOS4|nr:DUF4397 domain-containing protein [Vibrio sinaloensis]EGA69477.1 hypothetical protein VISI1226_09864 [Vibrio sinaloensis DSM 21326]
MWNKYSVVALVASLALVGCDDDDEKSALQAVHASVDAPLANVWINNSPSLVGVDYGVGSGYLSVDAGYNRVEVEVQLAGGATTTVIPKTRLYLDEDNKYTVFVVGEAAAGGSEPVEALVIERPAIGEANASSLDVQVVHASAGVPDVDLYVTAPGADINSASALDTLAYKDSTGVVNIAGGDYQVRLTLAGTKTVAFDSGTVSLASNSELTIAAIPNQDSGGSSLVKLLVLDGSSSSIIYNLTENAEVQVGHLVSDAPRVDVSLNGSEAISDLDFKDLSPYTAIAGGDYDIGVYPDNTPGTLVIDEMDVALNKGMDYGIFAVNKLATIEALVIETERRPVATSAVLNVIHAAPSASTVDVYLTATTDISTATPAISGFDFKEYQQGIYVAAGDYYVTVTPTGTKTAAIGPALVSLANETVYQAVAIDDDPTGFDLLLTTITD